MATIKSNNCIIGGNLSALLSAKKLVEQGHEVVILERSDKLGGIFAPTQTPFGALHHGLTQIARSDISKSCLDFIGSTLGRELEVEDLTLPPLTYNKGQLQPFVGFGENAPEYVEEFSHYLEEDRFILAQTYSSLTEELVSWALQASEEKKLKIHFNAAISKFTLNEKSSSIVSLSLEDGRDVSAQKFIYFDDARELFTLLPTEEYTQRELQKFHKTTLWTTLCLDIIHGSVVTESKNRHVLVGTTKESLPCVGEFQEPYVHEGKALQQSHWIVFISPEAEDDEVPANALREIKRQLKRAYPEALDHVLFEKITVHIASHGKLPLKADASSRWPGIDNFWMSSEHIGLVPGHFGAICQTQLLLAGLETQKDADSVLAHNTAEC